MNLVEEIVRHLVVLVSQLPNSRKEYEQTRLLQRISMRARVES